MSERKRVYERYLRSADWHNKRQAIFAERGRKCSKCGRGHRLHVHHVRYRKDLTTVPLTDLVVLCEKCHKAEHRRLRRERRANRKPRRHLPLSKLPPAKSAVDALFGIGEFSE